MRIFIFHGTEGHPEENWFPWLKQQLEAAGHEVMVPQFPSPPVVAAKVDEWFDVFDDYKALIDENTILIGHSLGGVFTLRVLEQLAQPIQAACFIGTPVGEKPVLNYDRDAAFSGFSFDWPTIRQQARHFTVYHSDDDPYVSLTNGEKLAENLHTELTFIPNAGHFNTKAGYTEFPELQAAVLATSQ